MLRPLVERLPTSTAQASTLDWRLKRFVRSARLPTLDRHYEWKSILSPDARAELLRSDRRGTREPIELLRERYEESEGAEELARVMDIDLGLFLVDDMLVKTDRASMAHSLEARVPLIDHKLVEFAATIPPELQLRGLRKKYLLKRAMAHRLPGIGYRGEYTSRHGT